MKNLKKPLKYIGLTALGIILLLLFISNFSESEAKFQCPGEISYKGTTQSITLYMKLAEYRPWIFWSDSSGTVQLEIPNTDILNYFHIEKVGDQRQIYKDRSETIAGNFSTLSKTLAISTPYGFFDGVCNSTD